ncbi:ATP-binding cassette domain-containing protein [Martelella lutilitoris]|uniref:ATP-binding cassette domain-containing protein n=1 Tax=Martelella lutilitoris TaxID=2583532 RepID=A0A5C4JNH6_9HYPH|nr:ATP-binding cassette domain-containing protein [Martelella lutilitoris]
MSAKASPRHRRRSKSSRPWISRCGRESVCALSGPRDQENLPCLKFWGHSRPQNKGRVLISGREVVAIGDAERTRLRREAIGFVFQDFNLIDHVSAADNVALPLRYRGVGHRAVLRRAKEALDKFGLSARAGLRCSRLSGGEKQRVAFPARSSPSRSSFFPTSRPAISTKRRAAIFSSF